MKSEGLALILNTIKETISKGQILINGVYKDIPVQKFEVTTDSIRIFIYVDEDYVGTITNFRLITNDGKVFDEKKDNITKDNLRGYLNIFEYKIKEV